MAQLKSSYATLLEETVSTYKVRVSELEKSLDSERIKYELILAEMKEKRQAEILADRSARQEEHDAFREKTLEEVKALNELLEIKEREISTYETELASLRLYAGKSDERERKSLSSELEMVKKQLAKEREINTNLKKEKSDVDDIIARLRQKLEATEQARVETQTRLDESEMQLVAYMSQNTDIRVSFQAQLSNEQQAAESLRAELRDLSRSPSRSPIRGRDQSRRT